VCALHFFVPTAAPTPHPTPYTHAHQTPKQKALAEAHRGVIVPPLPEKSAVQKFQMSAEFVEERRRALQVRVVGAKTHTQGARWWYVR
jgi:hypothetical protein